MIQKLRHRFIAVSMLAVFLVLLVMMTAINVVNYQSIGRRADPVLTTIADHGGKYPRPKKHDARDYHGDHGKDHDQDHPYDPKHAEEYHEEIHRNPFKWWYYYMHPDGNKEMPFEVRYFTVIFENGETAHVYADHIQSVTAEQAEEIGRILAAQKKKTGYSGKYRYMIRRNGAEVMVICLDRTREFSSFYTFLTTTIFISVLALILIYLLVLLFSRWVTRPMAESYAKQKRFITNASHDLKTPLAIIGSCTDVLEMEQGSSKWTEGIHQQVDRMTHMTNDLVSLSRMDEMSAADLEKTAFSLSRLAEDTLTPYYLLAREKGKELQLEIQPELTFFGNSNTIRQLLTILADNAVKYTSDSGTIQISICRKNHKMVITSRNPAEGLKKGSADNLFDRFYRADASRSSGEGGSGIGLSMARSIVTAHGGKISAWSEDGRTLTVQAVLPDHVGRKRQKTAAPTA